MGLNPGEDEVSKLNSCGPGGPALHSQPVPRTRDVSGACADEDQYRSKRKGELNTGI